MLKTKQTISFLGLAVLLAFLVLGCSSTPQNAKNNSDNNPRSDAQIAGDIQTRISSDPDLRNRQISINAEKGVITLGGTVSSKDEVMSALKDAQGVEGVKQVVSWLEVAPTQTATTEVEPQPQPQPKRKTSAIRSTRHEPQRSSHVLPPAHFEPTPVTPPSSGSLAADTNKPVAPPPVRAPEVVKVSVPSGTELPVRTSENLSSETSRPDEIFHGTLNSDVTLDDQVVIPAGANIEGRVVEVHSATHYAGESLLVLQLSKLSYEGKNYTVATDQWSRKGESRGGNTAKKVGAGAAIGAVLGGIFGGGKGAAIGAASGAGAGGAANTITKGKPIELRSESLIVFRTASPLTVIPGTSNSRHGTRLTANDSEQ
jgi:outer membrane lipoprotein SlyB